MDHDPADCMPFGTATLTRHRLNVRTAVANGVLITRAVVGKSRAVSVRVIMTRRHDAAGSPRQTGRMPANTRPRPPVQIPVATYPGHRPGHAKRGVPCPD